LQKKGRRMSENRHIKPAKPFILRTFANPIKLMLTTLENRRQRFVRWDRQQLIQV
jgi:hypothetical protein